MAAEGSTQYMQDIVFMAAVMILIVTVFSLLQILVSSISERKEREELRKAKEQVRKLSEDSEEMTPDEFRAMRRKLLNAAARFQKSKKKSGKKGNIARFPGVYILLNRSRNWYYVGQSVDVLSRVNNHFSGKGNGDVYADYKYGDDFSVRIIPLKGSGFSSLNDLERNAIAAYDSYYKGYNRTRGNR